MSIDNKNNPKFNDDLIVEFGIVFIISVLIVFLTHQ